MWDVRYSEFVKVVETVKVVEVVSSRLWGMGHR
jgi:hypothetical protein